MGDLNPVHKILDQLRDAFVAGADEQYVTCETAKFNAIIQQVADHLNVSVLPRQLAEAMPHLDVIRDFQDLRSILLRLGFTTSLQEAPAHAVRSGHLPCFLVDDHLEAPQLITGFTDGDDYLVAGSSKILARSSAKGRLYKVTVIDPIAHDAIRQRDGWINSLLASFIPSLCQLLGISFLLCLTGISLSLIVMAIYDFAITSQSLDTLAFLAIGALGLIALEVGLRRRRSRDIARLCSRFDALVSISAYRQVLSLPLELSEPAQLNTQLSRFRQFQIGRTLFSGSLASAILDLPFTILSFCVLFALGGSLAFIVVGLAIFMAILIVGLNPMMAAHSRASGDLKAKADSILTDIALKLNTIHGTSTEAIQHRRAVGAYRDYLLQRYRTQSLDSNLQTCSTTLMMLAGAAVLFVGAIRVMNETLTIGALSAVMAVIWRVLMPIQTVALSAFRLKQVWQTVNQIDQLMRMKSERRSHPIVKGSSRAINGEIQIANLAFRYPQRAEFALKSVSLNINRGHFLAITGASGSGKSTLLKMILGLYQPQIGSVSVDGANLRHLDMPNYRHSVHYLPQETRIFYGTLAQNVRLSVPEASDDEILHALDAMGITLPHPALPEGLSTRLRGRVASRGATAIQQRIALATILTAHRPMVLLDMPGQYLDYEADMALIEALKRMKRRSTIIVATQRPSHMQLADTVVLLNDGTIAAVGPPAQMIPHIAALAKSCA